MTTSHNLRKPAMDSVVGNLDAAAMLIRGRALPLPTYRRRRAAAARILSRAYRNAPLLVIGAGAEDVASQLNPQVGRARQDPWFDWFTGCHEPEAAVLIEPGRKPRDTLFLEAGDPARVVWDGARLGPSTAAKRAFGVHAVAPAATLRERVLAAAERAGGQLAMLTRKVEPGFQSAQFDIWNRRLRGVSMINLEPELLPLRMVKDSDEIAWHRRAVKTTASGLKAVMSALPKMRSESEVAGELARHYLAAGHEPVAFATIVGSAANAATLHYPHNDQPLVKRGCVLIDSGARAGGYCADVTRTLPQHGRFTNKRFREVYELVLHCMQLNQRAARPGVTLAELNEIAWQPIIEAGFTRHHGVSHHIGLDVHDPCDRERPLEAGMLISNEPGIYLPDEGIGVRIEDDLLITPTGCENTTRMIPKTISAIETAMSARR